METRRQEFLCKFNGLFQMIAIVSLAPRLRHKDAGAAIVTAVSFRMPLFGCFVGGCLKKVPAREPM